MNVHGRPGKNIPGDLHMEHLNTLAKEAIKNLGASKTEKGSIRIGKAIGTIGPVLQQFDNQSAVSSPFEAHRRASTDKDRNMIINKLMKNVFKTVLGRKHSTFPHRRNIKTPKGFIGLDGYKTPKFSCTREDFEMNLLHTTFSLCHFVMSICWWYVNVYIIKYCQFVFHWHVLANLITKKVGD